MDKYKAIKLEQILKGKQFMQYRISHLINNGKSAAVLLGEDELSNKFAIKIFDNDIVERFGHEIQENRIHNEISLKGHSIENLVNILDGGKHKIDNEEYYYIVMEFIEGRNLKQFIESNSYGNEFIQRIVGILFNVTEELLKKNIVHRDIKPENIMISSSDEITLMDLGVLKLIGVPSFSDIEEKQFLGTLRYAPPEFMSRTEQDTPDGWRAINLYQIGAVMHDLIMKEELFSKYVPYTNLVLAIKEDAADISNESLPYATIQFARDLLIKGWNKRLEICPNEKILKFCSETPADKSGLEKELEDIFKMTRPHKTRFEEIEKITKSNEEKQKKQAEISKRLDKTIEACLNELINTGLYSKITKSSLFYTQRNYYSSNRERIPSYIFQIEGDLSKGFPKPMHLMVLFSNDDNSLARVELLSMFLGPFIKSTMQQPLSVIADVRAELNPNKDRHMAPNIELKTYIAFQGIIYFDEQFKENFKTEVVKLIKNSLSAVSIEVEKELVERENLVKGINTGVKITYRSASKDKSLLFPGNP